MTFEIIQPDGMPAPSGFSYAVAASGRNMLFIAGQTAQDSSGNIVGSRDIVHQFECALDNVLRVLRAGGGQPDHVAKMTIFVTDVAAYRESLRPIGKIYRQHFGNHYPAMTLVEVHKLFDREAMIEIEAIAVIP
jgi:enamine deaminase RidA (YjgF/YER057c/UK114 family)